MVIQINRSSADIIKHCCHHAACRHTQHLNRRRSRYFSYGTCSVIDIDVTAASVCYRHIITSYLHHRVLHDIGKTPYILPLGIGAVYTIGTVGYEIISVRKNSCTCGRLPVHNREYLHRFINLAGIIPHKKDSRHKQDHYDCQPYQYTAQPECGLLTAELRHINYIIFFFRCLRLMLISHWLLLPVTTRTDRS